MHNDVFPVDPSICLRYAEGCYQFGKYEECKTLCDSINDQIASNRATLKNTVCLLKGKSLCHLYKEKLIRVFKQKSVANPVKELPKLMKECTTEMKQAILILGRVHDDHFLDEEGSKLLDWAMIDFIREENKLNDCKRCLLCRKKMVLKRSHIYPRSVLKLIAEPNIDEGEHRIFLHQQKGRTSAKAAGEITYWMLCSTCELRLSQNGENEFCKEFFSPVFHSSLNRLTEDAQVQSLIGNQADIEYGQWLYSFCIGILFRGLGISLMPLCRNSKKIYTVFLTCRQYVLSLPVKVKEAKEKSELEESSSASAQSVSSPSNIPVAILINPTSVDTTSDKIGSPFLPSTLLSSCAAALASLKLDGNQATFTIDAPFFLVRLGLVSILVEFESSSDVVDTKYYIKPEGGTFPVPSEEKRWNDVPDSLWKLFEKDAGSNQTANIEYFLKLASDRRLVRFSGDANDLKVGVDLASAFEPSDEGLFDQHVLNYILQQCDPEALGSDIGDMQGYAGVELPWVTGLIGSSDTTEVSKAPMTDMFNIENKFPQGQDLQYFSSETQINLLPKGFSFFNQMGCLTYNSVKLPEGHHILLHATEHHSISLCWIWN